MNSDQFWLWLNNNIFQAGMNIEYHQTMVWRYWLSEWVANFAIIFFIILGVVLAAKKDAIKKTHFKKLAMPFAIASAIFACALLITPFGAWNNKYNEFACEWNSIQGELADLEIRFEQLPENQPIPEYMLDRIKTIKNRMSQIEAQEPAPWPTLLARCYGDQVERMHGPGIRTAEQARKKLESETKKPILDQPKRPAPPGSISAFIPHISSH